MTRIRGQQNSEVLPESWQVLALGCFWPFPKSSNPPWEICYSDPILRVTVHICNTSQKPAFTQEHIPGPAGCSSHAENEPVVLEDSGTFLPLSFLPSPRRLPGPEDLPFTSWLQVSLETHLRGPLSECHPQALWSNYPAVELPSASPLSLASGPHTLLYQRLFFHRILTQGLFSSSLEAFFCLPTLLI